MAANPNAIWTVADVRNRFVMNISDSDVQNLINAVSDLVESYCHDKFASRAETLVFDGNDKLSLDLGSRASAITQISEGDNGSAIAGATNASTLVVRDPVAFPYVLHSTQGLVFSLFKWRFGVQNIKINLTSGWNISTSLPGDLREAAMQLIRALNDEGFGGGISLPLVSEHIGDYSYQRLAGAIHEYDIPTGISATLLRYRRWVLA